MKIAIISSSTRPGRTSHRVALALEKSINDINGITADLIDLAVVQLPLFTEVLAKNPQAPESLKEVSKKLTTADAILFVSPEYNGGYAPGLKNLIDFLGKAEFSKKVIGITSVSTGIMGGIRGALQMQQLIMALFAYPCPYMLLVPEVQKKFSDDGSLIDESFKAKVDTFVKEFLWLAQAVVKNKTAI